MDERSETTKVEGEGNSRDAPRLVARGGRGKGEARGRREEVERGEAREADDESARGEQKKQNLADRTRKE